MDLTNIPSVAEFCSAVTGSDNTWLLALDGTAKGAWIFLAGILAWAMRYLGPQAVHYIRQLFISSVMKRAAGDILVKIGGTVTPDNAKLVEQLAVEKVAEVEQRAGDTLKKVGLTPDLIPTRITGELGKLIGKGESK